MLGVKPPPARLLVAGMAIAVKMVDAVKIVADALAAAVVVVAVAVVQVAEES